MEGTKNEQEEKERSYYEKLNRLCEDTKDKD